MPKIPELDGIVERMSRTVVERVRSMLLHPKLLKSYWAEVMMMTTYLINKSPSIPLDGDVPQRVWIGRNVSYKHLRVFGCLAYMHVAKDHRLKLDNNSQPCIFLGYSKDDFGYRLWDLIDKWSEVEILYLWKTRQLRTRRKNSSCRHSSRRVW